MNNRLFEESKWNYYVSVIPIMLFFTTFLVWATFSEVDEVIRGTGKIIPSSQTKIIQNFEGGIIASINVKEGDHVKKGEVLYTLSNAFFNADLKSKEIELLSYKASAIRIKHSIDNKEILIFPKNIKNSIPGIIENEYEIFEEDLRNNRNKIKISQNKLKQKKYKLIELETKFENLGIELNLGQANMRIQEKLYKNKVISQKTYIDELSKKQNIVTRLSEIRNNIPIIEEEILEYEGNIENVKSEIRSKYLLKHSLLKIEINKLSERNKANEDRDQRKYVLSPVNGIINKLHFYTVGGIVKAGDKMVEIIPVDDSLSIEGKIKSADRASIWMGQDVSIEVTAYDFSKYGLLKGKLIYISPDSFEDRAGNVFYIVKVKSDSNSFEGNLPILPGMLANLNILTGKKSIIEYILKPLKNIKRNALSEQ
ncbi:MAG: hypothetical protein COA66_10040 [Arcobacter sp.]|nr:MAG: hypothetical protein COA66_10040 [Arcobacter sp.]